MAGAAAGAAGVVGSRVAVVVAAAEVEAMGLQTRTGVSSCRGHGFAVALV